MSTPETKRWGTEENDEAIAAWDGPLFDVWLRFRDVITEGVVPHGEAGLAISPPRPGERVLDIGCGLGDTTQRIAELVGPEGQAVGVDASTRMIEVAARESAALGIANARFLVADVQRTLPEDGFDMAFARFGTMFFDNPVWAMRSVHAALRPGGRLAIVVWRRREDNEWLYRAQQIVEAIVQRPDEYEEPTCGPGPFSMANADTVSDVLLTAGFTDVAFHRSDIPYAMGRSIEEAVELVMAIGPAGEILRLQGDRAAHLHGRVREALAEGFAELAGPDGIRAAASTWTVTAVA